MLAFGRHLKLTSLALLLNVSLGQVWHNLKVDYFSKFGGGVAAGNACLFRSDEASLLSVTTHAGTDCHHIVVEDWDKMEEPGGCLFVSMPSLLDPSLCPEGTHLVHIFTPDWIHNWQVTMLPTRMLVWKPRSCRICSMRCTPLHNLTLHLVAGHR